MFVLPWGCYNDTLFIDTKFKLFLKSINVKLKKTGTKGYVFTQLCLVVYFLTLLCANIDLNKYFGSLGRGGRTDKGV